MIFRVGIWCPRGEWLSSKGGEISVKTLGGNSLLRGKWGCGSAARSCGCPRLWMDLGQAVCSQPMARALEVDDL